MVCIDTYTITLGDHDCVQLMRYLQSDHSGPVPQSTSQFLGRHQTVLRTQLQRSEETTKSPTGM